MKRVYTMLFILCAFAYTAQSQVVLSEGFESGIPSDWTIETLATDGGWNAVADGSSGAWALPDLASGNVAVTNDDACNCDKSNDVLITPMISLAGLTAPILSFDRAFGAYAYQGTTEVATVEISVDGGTTWDILNTLDGVGTIAGAAASPEWANEGIDLAAYAGQEIMLAFRYSDNAGWLYAFAIDNVLVYEPLAWEVELTKLTIDPIYEGGQTVAISGQVKNLGANNITAFDLSWTDGTNNYNETITGSGVDIAPFGTYDFTATDAYLTAAATTDDITVIVSNPNGNMDGDNSNNALSTSVTGVAFIPTKRVVVEEATGTWCGWCPNGTVALEYMTDAYPETFIGIAMHNSDPMAFAEYDSNNGLNSYPASNVDREVNDTYPNSSNLEAIHNERVGLIVAADISNTVTYDVATREVTINVSSQFVAPATDYKFNLVIVEDSVTGTSSGFNQVNYFSGGANDLFSLDGTNWKDLPDPVLAADMVYDHVARALPVGYWGEDGSLPASIAAGETHTHTFTYTLPAEYDENHIHVVTMLMGTNGEIVNAEASEVPIPVSNKNLIYNENLAKVFPNPFSDFSTISLTVVNTADVSVQVYNTVGQMMGEQNFGEMTGEQTIQFNGSSLAEGMYYLHIIVGEQVITKKVTIVR